MVNEIITIHSITESDNKDVDINLNNIDYYKPLVSGKTLFHFNSGAEIVSDMNIETVRGLIKKMRNYE
jgi:hypothetical protein